MKATASDQGERGVGKKGETLACVICAGKRKKSRSNLFWIQVQAGRNVTQSLDFCRWAQGSLGPVCDVFETRAMQGTTGPGALAFFHVALHLPCAFQPRCARALARTRDTSLHCKASRRPLKSRTLCRAEDNSKAGSTILR